VERFASPFRFILLYPWEAGERGWSVAELPGAPGEVVMVEGSNSGIAFGSSQGTTDAFL